MYKKSGVIVGNIVASDAVQPAMFDFDGELREKNDRISRVMDAVNDSGKSDGNSLLRLASQRPGNYSEGIRSDYRSNRYSTSLDEIIEVH